MQPPSQEDQSLFNTDWTLQPTQQEIKYQIKALQRERLRIYQKEYYFSKTKQKRREQSKRNKE